MYYMKATGRVRWQKADGTTTIRRFSRYAPINPEAPIESNQTWVTMYGMARKKLELEHRLGQTVNPVEILGGVVFSDPVHFDELPEDVRSAYIQARTSGVIRDWTANPTGSDYESSPVDLPVNLPPDDVLNQVSRLLDD